MPGFAEGAAIGRTNDRTWVQAASRNNGYDVCGLGILDTCWEGPSRYRDRMPFDYPAMPWRP